MVKKGRRRAREVSMCLIYEWSMDCHSDAEYIMSMMELEEPDKLDDEFINELADGVKQHSGEIDELISRCAKDWKLERLAKTELSILRLCIYELEYRDDVPPPVSMHEAVELAKKYCRTEAASFINGVLSTAYKELLSVGRIAYKEA